MCCRCKSCDASIKTPTLVFAEWKDRSCTDVLFLLIFLALWAVVIGILASAIKDGSDPRRVLYPVDYAGRICGVDDEVRNASYGAWPHPNFFKTKICVDRCNSTEDPSYESPSGGKMILNYHTSPFLKFCLPNVQGTINIQVSVTGDFEALPELAARTMADLYASWHVIAGSGAIAVVLSYLYIYLVKYFAWCLLWASILLIIVGGFLTGFSFLKKAKKADDSVSTPRAKAMWVTGCIFIGLSFIFLCVVIFMRERIAIALEILKESARALQDMRMLIFFPFVPLVFAIGFFVWWIVAAVNIFSVKIEDPHVWSTCKLGSFPPCYPLIDADEWNTTYGYVGNGYIDYDWDVQYQKAFVVHFFSLLWNVQFLVYFTYVTIASAIAKWYFTPRDKDGDKTGLPYFPIAGACCRTFRFNLGSIAFGSLIIAIIQFARAVVNYVQAKMRWAGQKETRLQKCIFCLLNCCLKCLECCVDKINKNAYIWMVIWGDGFVSSTCNSFVLIWENLARVAAISVVGKYLLFVGKVVVALLTTGIAGLLLDHYYDDELNSNMMPLIVVFIIAYLVSGLFMQMFETVVDAMFICFLVDDKYNGGTDHMLASPGLQQIVNSYATKSQIYAKEMKSFRQLPDEQSDEEMQHHSSRPTTTDKPPAPRGSNAGQRASGAGVRISGAGVRVSQAGQPTSAGTSYV